MRALLLAAIVCVPSIAAADRPASKGLYAEGGMGATAMIGSGHDYSKVGPDLQVRLGYDLFSFLSIGVHFGASNHEATVPPPPVGEWFQLYRGEADGRLGFRANKVALFVEGGIGAAYLSSNVLEKVMITDPGEHLSLAFNGGGGLEYQIANRHYAFGVAGDWWVAPQFSGLTGVDARVYLRYTADGL
jgi:hypothetical protein